MGIFDDPTTMGLLGMAQGFGQAAMPQRMPVPFGAVMGMGVGGMQQGAQAANAYALQQQQLEQARLANVGLRNYYNALGSMGMQTGAAAPAQSAPAPLQPPPQAAAPVVAPSEQSLPRGLRNNNPLNIKFAGQNGATSDGTYAVFPNLESGLAATSRQLQLYGDRGLNTVRKIVSTWAPEGDASGYIASVSRDMGISPDDPLNLRDPNQLVPLMTSMARVENGRPMSPQAVQSGLATSGAIGGGGAAIMVPTRAQTQGMQPVPMDDSARMAVRQLVAMRNAAMWSPNGTGWRAVGDIQRQLDNIAGPGGIVDPLSGNVYSVPGALQQRFAAAQATEAGKVGPSLYEKFNSPVPVQAGGAVVIPSQMGGAVPPAGIVGPGVPQQAPAAPGAGSPAAQGQAGQPGVLFQSTTSPFTVNLGQKAADAAMVQAAKADADNISEMEKLNRSTAVIKGTTQTIRSVLPQVQTGMGAPFVNDLARSLTYLGVPVDKVKELTGINPVQGEILMKKLFELTSAAVRGMGAREPGSVMQMFAQNYPNMQSRPETIDAMTRLLDMDQIWKEDRSSAMRNYQLDSVNRMASTNEYRGLKGFDDEFNRTHDERVYVAAALASGGLDFQTWAKDLSTEQQTQALQLAQRVYPGVRVFDAAGRPHVFGAAP